MERKVEIPVETAGDAAHSSAKALLNIIPIVGGTLTEIFNLLVMPPIEKRRNEWMVTVVKSLQILEEGQKGIVQDLANNQEFISILIETSLHASKTHLVEKHKKLRNALINSIQNEFTYDIKQVYVNFINELTLTHIEVLKVVFEKPYSLVEAKSYQLIYDSLNQGKSEILTGMEISTFRFLLKDLESKGLLFISRELSDIENQVSKAGYLLLGGSKEMLPYVKVTDFGLNFLKFVETET